MFSYFWRDKWDRLKWWLNPRQKWLIKKIPNHWEDKDVLIELVLEECLIHFIEEENGFSLLNPGVIEDFKEAYEYVKTGRAKLEKECEDSRPKLLTDDLRNVNVKEINGIKFTIYTMKSLDELYGAPYGEAYKRYNELSKLIEEKNKWVHDLIFKNREHLWS